MPYHDMTATHFRWYLLPALALTACAQTPLAPTMRAPAEIQRPPLVIVRGEKPVDPADNAIRDIARYMNLGEIQLLDEWKRLERAGGTSSEDDLRRVVILWLLDKPEKYDRLEAMMTRLRQSTDARLSSIVGLVGVSIANQRRSNERAASLESKLAEANRHAEQLEVKIKALKALERELLSRPEPKADQRPPLPSPR